MNVKSGSACAGAAQNKHPEYPGTQASSGGHATAAALRLSTTVQTKTALSSMFTVPTALLCFDNLSSQNSPRKSCLLGLHKCMRVCTDRAVDGGTEGCNHGERPEEASSWEGAMRALSDQSSNQPDRVTSPPLLCVKYV